MVYDGVCIDLENDDEIPIVTYPEDPYCQCLTNYCECSKSAPITKKVAFDIYKHLGYSKGRDSLRSNGYRLNALNIWGTDNLNSNSIIKWLDDYDPKGIEWINDSSCNVLFHSEEPILRIIVDMTEPFDRQVAAAAALTVVANLAKSRTKNFDDSKVIDVDNDYTSEIMPSKGSWFKAPCVPDGAIALYLRFAHQSDVKLPGAEKRSRYYEKFGNPRNWNQNSSRKEVSARRKLKKDRLVKGRNLVSYEDLYEDDLRDPFEDSPRESQRNVFRTDEINYYVELANDDIDSDMITVTQSEDSRRSQAGTRHFFKNKFERIPEGPLRKYPRSGPDFAGNVPKILTLSDRWKAMHQAGIVGATIEDIERQTRGFSFEQPSDRRNDRNVLLDFTDFAADGIAQMNLTSKKTQNKNHQPLFKAGAFNQRTLLTSMGMIADLVEKNQNSDNNCFNIEKPAVHQRLNENGIRSRNSRGKKNVHSRLH